MRKRLIRRFLKKKSTIIICFSILVIFVCMSNGYSILNTVLNITGTSSIISSSGKEELWEPDVEFINTEQMGNIFFYDIIVHNNSENTCQDWEIKIYDDKNITQSFEYGEKEDGYRVIKNTNWDNKIEPGGAVTVTIIFTVSEDVKDTMTIEEYAKYFMQNYIKVSGTITEPNREGEIITNGGALLSLKKSEIQVTNFSITLDTSYKTEIENERQYIIDINNDTEYDFIKVRANVYLGKDNKMLEVSPSEITCINKTNTTFELPFWMQISKNTTTSIYIMVITEDKNFIPDIVLAAEIE